MSEITIPRPRSGPGHSVVLKSSGKLGRTYHDVEPIRGKIAVWIWKDFEYTGETLLVSAQNLEVIGYVD
jgi:hypothetical protein